MDELIKDLLATKDLWLPALTFLLGHLSASRLGFEIEKRIKARLKWLKDPEAEKAFRSAFSTAIERFGKEQIQSPAAPTVILVLTYIATHDVDGFDKAIILRQIFAPHSDSVELTKLVKRYAFLLEGVIVPLEEVNTSLLKLIEDYFKPAFLEHPYFTERIGFSEVIGLLEEILQSMAGPKLDFEELAKDYRAKLAAKYELVTMQGISPKVQNRTIGIRMEDVFIPLEAEIDLQSDSALNFWYRYSQSITKEIGSTISIESILRPSQLVKAAYIESLDIKNLTEVIINKQFQTLQASETTLVEQRYYKNPRNLVVHGGGEYKDILFSFAIKQLLRFPQIVIKGDPGSGKTTLTRYITWAYASGKFKVIGEMDSNRVPVRIRAIEFGDALNKGSVNSLEEYLLKEADRFSPLIKESLITGNTIVIIDGIDEVGEVSLQLSVKERIDDFIADPVFSDNHIIITTRIVGYEPSGLTGQFPHFKIAELNDDQISGFIENWYWAIHNEMLFDLNVDQEKKQLLDAIKDNPSIHRLARNPLLLTIIALIKWQGRLLPEQRVLLYDAAAQTLIRSWPLTQRHVEIDELFVREWLAPIAQRIMEEKTSDLIDEYSLMDELVKSMLRLKSMSEFDARRASQEMLNTIIQNSGFLLPRGNDPDGRKLFGFFHQTFAEYLCAYYLAGRWEDGEINLLDYAHEPYWREVLLLMAGHLGTNRRAKAGQFINAIRNLNSSPFEKYIHRDLLLAIRILADGIPAGPGEIIESLLNELLTLWQETPIYPLRKEIENSILSLKSTEYSNVILRLVLQKQLAPEQIITAAWLLGTNNFKDQLISQLIIEDDPIKLRTAELLFEIGDQRGIDILVTFAEKSNESLEGRAGAVLVKNGDSRGVRPLLSAAYIERFEDFSPRAFLETYSETYPAIKSELIRLLSDENPRICLGAASIILKSEQPLAVGTLVGLLDSDDRQICLEAALILAELNNLQGFEVLKLLLSEKDEWIRFRAAEFLINRDDTVGVDPLLKKQSPPLRFRAAEILYRQNNPHGIEILLELLGAGEAEVRFSAARFLAEEENSSGIAALSDLLNSSDQQIVLNTAKLLAKRNDQDGLETLKKFLEAPDPRLRYQASQALMESKDTQVQAILKAKIKNMLNDHAFVPGTTQSVSALAYQYLIDQLSPTGKLFAATKVSRTNRKRKNTPNLRRKKT